MIFVDIYKLVHAQDQLTQIHVAIEQGQSN